MANEKQIQKLQAGDTVRIISTARKISKKELEPAIKILEGWGLQVSFGKHLFEKHHQFAGTAKQRTIDLQEALDNDELKAIICARGGYGTVQLIDALNFENFVKRPKWLVGYSDVTVLHNHINQNFGIQTVHANMPISFPKEGEDETTTTLKKALWGESYELSFELAPESRVKAGINSAPIVGGNLSILYSLTGTASQINTEGKFLFMEDLDEYLYHIDRMMMNLKRAELFKGCKGVLIGGMSDMNDNTIPYGQTAKEIILENLEAYDFPIVFGVPAGHIKRNLALAFNQVATLKIERNRGTLSFNGNTQ